MGNPLAHTSCSLPMLLFSACCKSFSRSPSHEVVRWTQKFFFHPLLVGYSLANHFCTQAAMLCVSYLTLSRAVLNLVALAAGK